MQENSPTPSTSPERDQAIRLLKDWLLKGSIPSESGDWQSCSGLTREIVWSCLRHKGALDAWVDHLSNKRPADNFIPTLWVGLCQLLLLDGVPEHAAVHETLEAAKRTGVPRARIGFANALFRRTLREKSDLLKWMENQLPEIRYSHPDVLVKRWISVYGTEKTEKILQWNQDRSHTYARLTAVGRELKSDLLLPAGALPHVIEQSDAVFIQLPRGFSPSQLEDFDQGAWYIQDPSTARAPVLLDVQPGERVLDACAAPGGKTCMLAEALQEHRSGLSAWDPNPKRCERLRENLNRMKMSEVEVACKDITAIPVNTDDLFDAILLDVPCSNTGVYQRRPDAKWNFRRRMLTELIQLQYAILENAVRLLKPGGRLVYSTCSIEEEETTRQIRNWLGQHPDYSLETECLHLPGEQNCDGAYAVRIRKPA